MTRPKLLLVINPESGTGVTDADIGVICRRFANEGYDLTIRFTEDSGDAKKWFAEEHEHFDWLVVAGGDGSIKEAAEGLITVDSKRPMGILPVGSTCDFAESIGMPRSLDEATEYLINAEFFPVDIGIADTEPFIYICSFGAFTETSWQTSRSSKKTWGHLAYVFDAAKRLTQMRTYQCRIQTDQETFEGKWWFGAIMNSRQIGGVVKLPTDEIALDDGKMELLLIREPSNVTKLPVIISNVLSGSFQHEDIIFRHVSEVSFAFDEAVPFTLDGEFGGDHQTLDVKVNHHALMLRTKDLMSPTEISEA